MPTAEGKERDGSAHRRHGCVAVSCRWRGHRSRAGARGRRGALLLSARPSGSFGHASLLAGLHVRPLQTDGIDGPYGTRPWKGERGTVIADHGREYPGAGYLHLPAGPR